VDNIFHICRFNIRISGKAGQSLTLGSTFKGKLHSEDGLVKMFSQNGFRFESVPSENGALLYFRGIKE